MKRIKSIDTAATAVMVLGIIAIVLGLTSITILIYLS